MDARSDPARARRVVLTLGGLAGALVLVAVAGSARGGSGDGAVRPTGVRLLTDLALVVLGLLLLTGLAGMAFAWVTRVRLTPPTAVDDGPLRWWQRILIGAVNGLVVGSVAAFVVVAGSSFLQEMRERGLVPGGPLAGPTRSDGPLGRGPGDGGIDWPAVGTLIVLVAASGAAWLFAGGQRHPVPDPADDPGADDPLAALRAAGLDELRREPDPRQAVIRAYAAMAALLGSSGLPRQPSETPFEYLDRVLVALGSSAQAAHRLTVLFEQAKFSQHPITPAFKAEAISAVRSLRAQVAP